VSIAITLSEAPQINCRLKGSFGPPVESLKALKHAPRSFLPDSVSLCSAWSARWAPCGFV